MKRRRRRKKHVEGAAVAEVVGRVTVLFNKDTKEALEEVRGKMSRILGEWVSSATIVRMYLEKGLIADKALPRPQTDKVESHA
jgi:hypothetical protein